MNIIFEKLAKEKQIKSVRLFFYKAAFVLAISVFLGQNCYSQQINSSKDRVKTDLKIDLPYIGSVQSRNALEIESSNWLIGCETLDRDYADYHQYKEYLAPLGIKLLRMQAGWAKTEKIKGQYDWAWLDHIVNDATSRGLKPWLQTSYANTLYPDGGGANLGAGMPTSKEALKAYDKWVTALITRYKDKVNDWEVWNEPNCGDNTLNTPEMNADQWCKKGNTTTLKNIPVYDSPFLIADKSLIKIGK